jgi:putative membrane protein
VTVVLRDQAVRGLRSLTGLRGPGPLRERGAPEVVGRTVTHHLSDGAVVRTVATLDREPPVGLEVTITLDGRPVTASQVVGRSGRLEVTYTLVNRTAEARELRYFDGAGRPRTTVRDLAVPMVGELVVGLDDRFRAVRADGATFVDGTLRAELVLAEPVGAPVATVSWSADVRDGAVPPVHVRLAPVALTDTARGGVDVERLRRSTAALREVSDTAGLALTGVQALGSLSNRTADRADDDLAMRTAAILGGLLDGVATAGAELGELRALVERQDERARAGEGAVHGLLADGDVRRTAVDGAGNARPRVSTAAVYVLDIAGTDGGGLPGTLPRLLLALVLLAAAGSLGRSIARLTGSN